MTTTTTTTTTTTQTCIRCSSSRSSSGTTAWFTLSAGLLSRVNMKTEQMTGDF